ncbi:MAG: hypothetical protein IPJ13_21940 [Saprospiraceae bacterium]|nr:hypothetical protein [Saprospiraceae bacterium]
MYIITKPSILAALMVIVYFDLLDRQKKRQEESLYNTWTNEIITYDNRGNVSSKTQPYLSGESILTTTNLYDTYNRLVSSTNLFGSYQHILHL